MNDDPREDYLYVIVRGDFSYGYQMAQACHAVEDHTEAHPRRPDQRTMIVLSIPDETSLRALHQRVKPLAPTTIWWEPDVNSYTAMAVSPSPFYNLFKYLPLAGGPKGEA